MKKNQKLHLVGFLLISFSLFSFEGLADDGFAVNCLKVNSETYMSLTPAQREIFKEFKNKLVKKPILIIQK